MAPKKSKKGQKKKATEPFAKKEWYVMKAPTSYTNNVIGWTPVNKTAGTKISSDSLKGRVVEVSLADLNKNSDSGWRKLKYCVEEIESKNCLTNFHGMDMTRDSLCMLLKKWTTLIEAHVDVKTADGYLLRMFCIGFTKKREHEVKKTCYAQTSQIKQIRRKMTEQMTKEAQTNELSKLVARFNSGVIGKEIVKNCAPIFPLKNVMIRKVKVLKKPKFDLSKLKELYRATNKPQVDERQEETDAKNTLAAAATTEVKA
mmetsp:Transcript_22935/g.25934  ORF Transcript_22935/g.25934 Transcript_22935/m.25934 type:complete len:258 (+) Transcript_22935:45-818(+)